MKINKNYIYNTNKDNLKISDNITKKYIRLKQIESSWYY